MGNDCKAILMTGRSLAGALLPMSQEEDAEKDLELIIHIDRALGLSSNMTFTHGSLIRVIKEQLAQADPTGMTKPEDFGLRVVGSEQGSALLDDAEPITAGMVELEVCLPGA